MKIFNNFDTRLDETKFLQAIDAFGQDSAILIRKHPICLWGTIFPFIGTIIVCGTLLWILWGDYTDHTILRYGCTGVIGMTYIFWCFKVFRHYLAYFTRPRYIAYTMQELRDFDEGFEIFLRSTSMVLAIFFLVVIGNIIVEYSSILIHETIWNAMGVLLWEIILSGTMIGLVWHITLTIINFDMDYTIISPISIEYTNQNGLFSRKNITIGTEKVAAIQASDSGFFHSVFNYGTLTFATEGEAIKSLVLRYVHDTDTTKAAILTIIGKKQ